MKRKLLLLIPVIILLPSFCFAETIVLKSKEVIKDKILWYTDEYIQVRRFDSYLDYDYNEIESIDGKAIADWYKFHTTPWGKMQFDFKAIRYTFDEDLLVGLIGLITLMLGICAIIYFFALQKCLPTRFGPIPLDSSAAQTGAVAVAIFLVFSIVFQKSVLLRVFLTLPIAAIAWLITRMEDGDKMS